MNNIAIHRPGLLGHKYLSEVLDNLFSDQHFMDGAIKHTTKGYPVADIYRDDDGSTVLEFALAGFKKKELAIDIQPDKRSITITGKANEENSKRQRIARRNFTRTYVNYDDNLDLSNAKAAFNDGLLTVRVPQRPEVKPVSIDIQ
jgi:HSP20 family protein